MISEGWTRRCSSVTPFAHSASLRQIFEFELHGDKAKFGQLVSFLGLQGDFLTRSNSGKSPILLPGEKAGNWRDLAESISQEGRISYQLLGGIIGEL